LPALLEVYPDARFIVPHRDPAVSLASACDFWELQMRAFTEKVDTEALGAHWLEVYCDALEALQVALDEQVDPSRVVELQYSELKDALGAVGRVYDQLDIPLTADAEQRMANFLAHHRPGQHGVHEYSLGRYGLDPDDVAARFAPWVERFGIEVR
jgi:Sulfotransferase family